MPDLQTYGMERVKPIDIRFEPDWRPGGCRILTPHHARSRQVLLRLGIGSLNALLAVVKQPDALMDRLVYVNRQLCGLRSHYLKAGGLIWPYLDGGRGDTVVLLHGFGAAKDHMVSLALSLRRFYRVIVPDLPGFGDHTPDWSASYDVESQVCRLEQFFNALGVERFHLLGVSLGGYVAAYFAALFPDRARTLALMDSSGFSAPVCSDAMALFQERGRNIFLYESADEFDFFMRFLIHELPGLPAGLRHHWAERGIAQLRWRRKLFDDLIVGGIDLMDRMASRIEAPTLVLWGQHDRICHVSTVPQILDGIADCRAYIFNPCGHLPLIEYPQICRKLYCRFLQHMDCRCDYSSSRFYY